MYSLRCTSNESFIKPEICYRKVLRLLVVVFSKISVEPTLFLTLFSSIMYQMVVQNLYLEKACRVEIKFNESICEAMTTRNHSGYTQHQETEVQKLVSQMLALRTILQGSFPFIIVIFAGSWSDRYNRRKPLILMPIIGEIICCLLLILNSIFFYELPLIFTTLGDSIPFSLFGGWPCFNIGVFSYVGSKYKDEEKTMRIGIVTVTLTSALLLGSSAGGFIYQKVGFISFFSICLILLCVGFVIGYFRIHEQQTEVEENEETSGTFKHLFGVEHLISTIKTGFKSGPNKRRCKILAIMLTLLVASGTTSGEIAMNYMFTRLKFAWNAAQFAVYTGIQLFVQILGSVLGVVFFTKILKMEDTLLGIISMVGSISSNFVVALTTSEFLLFVGACCDAFQMCAVIALRSLVCKIVPPNEQGQTNSLLALIEALNPMIFGTVYATVYQKTVDVFPETYFFVSAGIRMFGLGFFLWLYKEALVLKRCSRKKAEHSLIEKYKMNPDEI